MHFQVYSWESILVKAGFSSSANIYEIFPCTGYFLPPWKQVVTLRGSGFIEGDAFVNK